MCQSHLAPYDAVASTLSTVCAPPCFMWCAYGCVSMLTYAQNELPECILVPTSPGRNSRMSMLLEGDGSGDGEGDHTYGVANTAQVSMYLTDDDDDDGDADRGGGVGGRTRGILSPMTAAPPSAHRERERAAGGQAADASNSGGFESSVDVRRKSLTQPGLVKALKILGFTIWKTKKSPQKK